jgi:hypothetical protein
MSAPATFINSVNNSFVKFSQAAVLLSVRQKKIKNLRRLKMLAKIGMGLLAVVIGVLMLWKSNAWAMTTFPSKLWGLAFIICGIGIPFGFGMFAE